jgi:hypothetical protein
MRRRSCANCRRRWRCRAVLTGEGRYWRNLQNKRHGIILLPGFGRHLGVAAILLFMVHGVMPRWDIPCDLF